MLASVLRSNELALAAALLATTIACSKSSGTAATTSSASPAPSMSAPPVAASSGSPAWLAFASRAPTYGEQARTARAGAARKPPTLAEIDALFDRMTKEPETAAGLRAAAKMLEGGKPLASDPTWTGSGTSPGAKLLHHGGMALLVDLTQRACAANAGDKEIGKAADSIALPSISHSGGVDRGAAERDRHAVQEAARACGATPGPDDPLR